MALESGPQRRLCSDKRTLPWESLLALDQKRWGFASTEAGYLEQVRPTYLSSLKSESMLNEESGERMLESYNIVAKLPSKVWSFWLQTLSYHSGNGLWEAIKRKILAMDSTKLESVLKYEPTSIDHLFRMGMITCTLIQVDFSLL